MLVLHNSASGSFSLSHACCRRVYSVTHITWNGSFAQYGALAALKEKEKTKVSLHAMLVAFDRRRKFLHAELNRIPGVSCLLAQGAFYLFPNIARLGLKDQDFCAQLLEKERVAAVPGSAFGAEGYLRLAGR